MAQSTVKVVELSKVTPEPPPSNPFTLPLTFFDTFWIKLPPVERIFLYHLPDLSPSTFRTRLLPRLTRSLSFTLRHYLPVAGNLVWPSAAAVPVVLYSPGDGVSLAVAESTDDFDHISADGDREASDSLPYVPELHASDSAAAILSLQITLFPNRGFCIGVTSQHGILDGKTQSVFMKAWAHTCRQIVGDGGADFPPPLPESLAPVFDRTGIVDSREIAVEYLDDWFRFRLNLPGMDPNPNPRSLELLWSLVDGDSKRLRATFDFSKERIKKLKESLIPKFPNPNYLSSFVLTLAHTQVCLVKAKGIRGGATMMGGFTADFRSRLEPPAPGNFFGNIVFPYEVALRGEEAGSEGGVAYAAGKIVEAIKEVEKGPMAGARGRLARFLFPESGQFEVIGVAGSPRLGMYGVDFGYGGRPRKVEVTSTARTGAISMAESRDGSGGVEVGIVLSKEEMDVFRAAFVQ
ncbi:unnamed protein product [Linum tenue]|uniref:Uncharacterized protein n=3 Tax=Linum tenue TaxID=586396 RepID=A0AAV0I7H4_9ROSI|nr:unnamed protein product [Linum tenue]